MRRRTLRKYVQPMRELPIAIAPTVIGRTQIEIAYGTGHSDFADGGFSQEFWCGTVGDGKGRFDRCGLTLDDLGGTFVFG